MYESAANRSTLTKFEASSSFRQLTKLSSNCQDFRDQKYHWRASILCSRGSVPRALLQATIRYSCTLVPFPPQLISVALARAVAPDMVAGRSGRQGAWISISADLST